MVAIPAVAGMLLIPARAYVPAVMVGIVYGKAGLNDVVFNFKTLYVVKALWVGVEEVYKYATPVTALTVAFTLLSMLTTQLFSTIYIEVVSTGPCIPEGGVYA